MNDRPTAPAAPAPTQDPVEVASALLYLDDEKALKPPIGSAVRACIEGLVGEVERLRAAPVMSIDPKALDGMFSVDLEQLANATRLDPTAELVRQATNRFVRQQKAVLKSMLGRWASEKEPALWVQQQTGFVMGLYAADDPTHTVVVAYDPALDGPQVALPGACPQ